MATIRPFLATNDEDPRCHLLAAAGLAYGERSAPEPSGRLALWFFQHRHVHSRTATTETFRTSSYLLQLEIGKARYSLRLA